MKKILVATDGSNNSDRALVEAKKQAEYTSGKITILHIVEDLDQYHETESHTISINDLLENEGQIVLKDSLKLFDDFKGEINTKLRRGNPADQIIKEAKDGNYDLIIMGSRGLSTFSRAILGSVSNKVLSHTDKNVLIIK